MSSLLDVSTSWALQTYDSRCFTRLEPWQIVPDWNLEGRQMQGSDDFNYRIPEDQNSWMLEFGAGQDLLDQCWKKKKKAKAGDQLCRDVSFKRIKKVGLRSGGWFDLCGLLAKD